MLPSQIAVITPCVLRLMIHSRRKIFDIMHSYQAQVTLLTSLLRPIFGPELEIGTVDGMQGREKEAVIISLVRSNDKVRFFREVRVTDDIDIRNSEKSDSSRTNGD